MSNKSNPPQLLLRPREAAAALCVSERKLWEMTDRGEIPVVRFDRCVRYSVDALQRWIGERQARPAAQQE